MKISSLITALLAQAGVAAVDGEPVYANDSDSDGFVRRFRKLFDKPDSTVVCELDDGRVMLFNRIEGLVRQGVYGADEITAVYAIPNLLWDAIKKQNLGLRIEDLRDNGLRSSSLEWPPASPPLDGAG